MTSTDPRPQKRRRVIDENEVDIFGSDYGDDILMENEAGPSGTTHRYVLTSLSINCHGCGVELTVGLPEE